MRAPFSPPLLRYVIAGFLCLLLAIFLTFEGRFLIAVVTDLTMRSQRTPALL